MYNFRGIMANRDAYNSWLAQNRNVKSAQENLAAFNQNRQQSKVKWPKDLVTLSPHSVTAERVEAQSGPSTLTDRMYTRPPTARQKAEGGRFNATMEWVSSKDEYQRLGISGILGQLNNDSPEAKATERLGKTLEYLIPEKSAISDAISSVARESGLADSDIRKLKVEINAAGNIVVGGLQDVKMAKSIQAALNKTEGLAARIKNYQAQERIISDDVRALNIGGGNLVTGNWGMKNIEYAVRNGLTEGESMAADFNNPLAYAVAELYSADGPDFSKTAKGVADPVGTLKKDVGKAKGAIEDAFRNANSTASFQAKNNGESGEGLDQMSLNGATIRIGAEGQVMIEGCFAQSDSLNSEAEALVRKILGEMFGQFESGNGAENALATAARQLTVMHDDTFGKNGKFNAKQAVLEISGRKTDVYVDSPGAREALNDEIGQEAAQYLSTQLGVEFSQENIEVVDKGTIRLKGIPQGVSNKTANLLVDDLNKQIAQAMTDPTGSKTNASDPNAVVAQSIADKAREMASYGPGSDMSYARDDAEASNRVAADIETGKVSDERSYDASSSGKHETEKTVQNVGQNNRGGVTEAKETTDRRAMFSVHELLGNPTLQTEFSVREYKVNRDSRELRIAQFASLDRFTGQNVGSSNTKYFNAYASKLGAPMSNDERMRAYRASFEGESMMHRPMAEQSAAEKRSLEKDMTKLLDRNGIKLNDKNSIDFKIRGDGTISVTSTGKGVDAKAVEEILNSDKDFSKRLLKSSAFIKAQDAYANSSSSTEMTLVDIYLQENVGYGLKDIKEGDDSIFGIDAKLDDLMANDPILEEQIQLYRRKDNSFEASWSFGNGALANKSHSADSLMPKQTLGTFAEKLRCDGPEKNKFDFSITPDGTTKALGISGKGLTQKDIDEGMNGLNAALGEGGANGGMEMLRQAAEAAISEYRVKNGGNERDYQAIVTIKSGKWEIRVDKWAHLIFVKRPISIFRPNLHFSMRVPRRVDFFLLACSRIALAA